MEKYHANSVIQDFVFSSQKRVVSGVFHCRYIIKTLIRLHPRSGSKLLAI